MISFRSGSAGYLLAFTAALPLSLVAISASAEEASYPQITGELSVEIENDWTYQSEDPSTEINDLYPTVVLGTNVALSEVFSLNFEATLEPVKDATSDRAFEDLGGYLNIITANYDGETLSAYAGKFTPNFGIAWDIAPGIFGTNLNEDYELAEMIGFGGGFSFDALGEHTISASTFFQDTSFLSNSVGTKRGPLRLSDGGVANTEDFSSFAVALDGNFQQLAGFRYHLGFSSLGAGEDGNDRQLGYAVGGEYAFNVGENVTLSPMAEYVYFDNYGGINDDTANYFTAGLAFNYENWVASSTYQLRDTKVSGVTTDDYVVDLTLGYEFDMGLGVAAAWRGAEESNVDSEGLGLLLSYAIEF
ncbi:hypothetical protein J0X12_00720 [Sneathiella sp. CAU 1612]|uniref:Porin n=1 Tax=Sneathiella sedimenti TaxID=2816034 RepID=A0ABS3F0T0_9PROT|nr:hypothetical protein [Sneathiella sedimenti]MBO0332115.1 hypothetical protein [Sneathiella sedimenti]